MIKISIILPCYNIAQYVERCLDSIISQSLKEFEIIIINDGSKDNLLDVCKKYSTTDKRIKIYTFDNQGLSQARNEGLLLAKGEYVYFCDPDDYINPDTLSIIYNKAKEGDYDAVHFGFKTIYEDQGGINYDSNEIPHIYTTNQEIITEYLPKFIGIGQDDLNKWKNIGNIWSLKEFSGVWRFLYKREVLINNNVFFRKGVTLFEDKLFNALFFLYANNICCIDNILYNYIIKNKGLLTSSLNSNKLINDKINGIYERELLRRLYLNKKNIDIFPMYIGTCVLSIIEIILRTTSLNLESYIKGINRFANHPDVVYAIKEIKLKGVPFKIKLAIYFLKFKLTIPLAVIYKTLNKIFHFKISV